jgi:serine/threonine protein phosphatase PrpC
LSRAARAALMVRSGFATERGGRPENQDYVAARLGANVEDAGQDVVAAVADGIGGHKGGREAAELTIREFIDGYFAMPETLDVQRCAVRSLEAINAWIYAQSRSDLQLSGMGCTFSGLVLSRRSAHVFHIGDSRIYRLSDDRLDCLTNDHVLGRGDLAHVLQRAIGFEESVRLDHSVVPLRLHDRFLLCTDGVHAALGDVRLKALLGERATPDKSARSVVAAALSADANDNATALVLDVVDLPAADQQDLTAASAELPILALPKPGDAIDGFALGEVISNGNYSRLLRATDGVGGRAVVLKFPHPKAASDGAFRLAFVREAWAAARVRSRWIGEIIELPAGRQTRLYSVMPYYDGETLEKRLQRSAVSPTSGVRIAVMLARAVDALHRIGVIHRDIKPENVILTSDGGLRLIDLGVARVPRLEDFSSAEIPGTASFMAPELFQGLSAGNEATDMFALGVTTYRMFTGSYPYGEVEPFTRPRFGAYASLSRARPDLPAWLDALLAKAVNLDPAARLADATELAHELELGAALAGPSVPPRQPLYERNPVKFWQMIAVGLVIVIIALLARDAPAHLR